MRSYGQFCPIAKAAELFCERWTALLIRNMSAGACRFTDIHRGVPHMSATMLSRRLKQLEAEGLVARRRSAAGGSWTYHLTAAGAEFAPLVGMLGVWGRRWMRRDLRRDELDLGLLIWGLEFTVDPRAFGSARTVLRLDVTDQPRHKALYWFVMDAGVLDLCVTDPGFDPDLYLAAGLRDLTRIYLGDLDPLRAISAGRLEVLGSNRLVRRLPKWFNPGPLAAIEPAAEAPLPRAATG